MTVRYAVHLSRPPVDLAFEVDEQGHGFVEAMTAASLPQAPPMRLGRFALEVGSDTHDALARLAGSGEGGTAGGAHGAPSRYVGTGPADLAPVSAPAEVVDPIEAELADAAMKALDDPIQAVRVGTADGATLTVESIGTEPFAALFHEGADFRVQVWRDDPATPTGRTSLAPEDVDALVADGTLATGPTDLAPGSVVVLPLPPGSGNAGGFTFWHAPGGPQRRIVSGTWFHQA